MSGVLWQRGVRSTTASGPTARSATARPRSSSSPSKGAGPWPGSLRQPQPSKPMRNSSYEWLRKRGQVTHLMGVDDHGDFNLLLSNTNPIRRPMPLHAPSQDFGWALKETSTHINGAMEQMKKT